MTKPNLGSSGEAVKGAPPPNDMQVIVLKVPDGFKPSTTVENAPEVPPVKPARIAFPFEEIR
ncbi:hypothetical protein PQR67_03385 [Paraburkholderia fungorum]|uniref:hypothetical protein n=1 Tax=Paraburkholderia fungorum TaxID=134537 RepID=UPI0038B8F952